MGLFASETFKVLVNQHPEVDFVLIFDRKPDKSFLFAENISSFYISPPGKHVHLLKIWYQFSLKRLLRKIKPDLFIGTTGMIPINTDIKCLSIIHDLNFEHYPEMMPKVVRNYYQNYYPKCAQQAVRIATVSEFSKKDISNTYHINKNKIDVVFNGANKNFKPIAEDEKTIVQNKYTEGNPFFLFVGTIHPRKNLINLFKAFDKFKSQFKSNFKLLVIGKKMWSKEIEKIYHQLQFKNDVVFTGRLDENKLYKVTASAYALTYVPIFEGFGIPLVEAMSCGVPVITSNVTSMPEVVKDAGFLVNPFSVDDIAEAMIKIVSDEKLRHTLVEKSKIQALQFSWEQTADLLWKSIMKAIDIKL